jgi:hypothetical protein
VKSFLAYDPASRTHLSLAKDPPEPRSVQLRPLAFRPVGGLHHRYKGVQLKRGAVLERAARFLRA